MKGADGLAEGRETKEADGKGEEPEMAEAQEEANRMADEE